MLLGNVEVTAILLVYPGNLLEEEDSLELFA